MPRIFLLAFAGVLLLAAEVNGKDVWNKMETRK